MKKLSLLLLILFVLNGIINSQSLKRSGEYYYVMNHNNRDTIYSILVNNDKIIDTTKIYSRIKSNKYFYIKDTSYYETGRFRKKSSKSAKLKIQNHFIMKKTGIWKERYPEYEYIKYFGLIILYSSDKLPSKRK